MFDQQKRHIFVDGLALSLDSAGGEVSFISHAHSDHACHEKSARRIIASQETVALIGSEKEKAEISGITLLEAGHILGSRQICAEVEGGTFVYTGDFKMEKGLTTEGAEVPSECDFLLMEGTYGEPSAKFPKREDVFLEMEKWVRKNREKNLVFGAYETGKSQEVVKFLNSYCGIAPIVSRRIDSVCEVYEKFGCSLHRIRAGTKEAEDACRGGFVAVLPMNEANFELSGKLSSVYGREALCALATGWAYKRAYSADKMFCLSDHADFEGILEYVQGANPKKIYCTHGNEKRLSGELKKRGFDAEPLMNGKGNKKGGIKEQMTLEMCNK